MVNNHKNRKCVKAINLVTQEVFYFRSMYAVQKRLGINSGIVKMVCEGTDISKVDKYRYKFEYIKEEDMLGK